jgi:O-antigen ligase
VLPLTTTDEAAFTNRGLVWMVSLRAWDANPWFGHGANWYEVIGSSSSRIAGSVFHGHNQFVQFMVTGGILFGLLVIPQLVVATVRATKFAVRGDLFGITWLAVLGGACLFEKSFSYVDNGNFLVAMVVPFAFVVLGHDRPSDDVGPTTAKRITVAVPART